MEFIVKKRLKSKTIELKYFIIPFLLIVLAYTYLVYGAMVSWIRNNYDLIRADAINVARVYSQNLNKSTKAKELLYDLIDERLLMASSALSQRTEGHSNELLRLLASELNVDVIHSYDRNGVMQYDSLNTSAGKRLKDILSMIFCTAEKNSVLKR